MHSLQRKRQRGRVRDRRPGRAFRTRGDTFHLSGDADRAGKTVRGGTGWGAECAKLCNKPIFVFDQDADRWFRWAEERWVEVTDAGEPRIRSPRFTGTGTRFLEENGRQAIRELFERSYA